jgi:hypothetical protein
MPPSWRNCGGVDAGDLQVGQVLVIDHQNLAGFLGVDDELRVVVRGDDGRDAGLRMVFLGADHHAAGRFDAQRLQGVAFHDDELRRPVGAGDRILVFVTLELGGFHRARFEADLDFGDVGGSHPQVDQVDARIAADHVEVAAGLRHARDMHRIAGLEDLDDLLALAVDQRDLAGIAQGDGEQVAEIEIVHLLRRALARRHSTFSEAIISFMPHSGGVGGSCWM